MNGRNRLYPFYGTDLKFFYYHEIYPEICKFENEKGFAFRSLNELSVRSRRLLNAAEKMAGKSNYRFKHGAVVADKRGNFLASGHNDEHKGNSLFRELYVKVFTAAHPGSNLHAEFAALGKIPCDNILEIIRLNSVDILRNATIYSFREDKAERPADSRPCKRICWRILKRLGFKDAIYVVTLRTAPHTVPYPFIAHEYF